MVKFGRRRQSSLQKFSKEGAKAGLNLIPINLSTKTATYPIDLFNKISINRYFKDCRDSCFAGIPELYGVSPLDLFYSHNALALVCGPISGNATAFIFRQSGNLFNLFYHKMLKIYPNFCDWIYLERTPTDNIQIIIKSESLDGLVGIHNLAMYKHKPGIILASQGSRCVVSPTPQYTPLLSELVNLRPLDSHVFTTMVMVAQDLDDRSRPLSHSV